MFVLVRVVSRPRSPRGARDVQEYWAISGVCSAIREEYGGGALFRSLLRGQLFEKGMCWLSLLQRVPKPELLPLARVVCSLSSGKLPLAIVGGSPSLVSVLGNTRSDSRVFVSYQPFTSEMLIRCIRQAYQDVFSMMEVTSLVDYTVLRLKTAIYEDWMEERVILCKSVRQGHVEFADLREVLSDLIELWPSIRPFVRCSGNPEAKDKAERVSENGSFGPL